MSLLDRIEARGREYERDFDGGYLTRTRDLRVMSSAWPRGRDR